MPDSSCNINFGSFSITLTEPCEIEGNVCCPKHEIKLKSCQCVPNSKCIDNFDPRSGGFESERNIQGDVCCDERNIITKEIKDCMC